MTQPAVIGVTGRKRSGKDEVYKALARNGLSGVFRVAFADALKQELAKACKHPPEFIEEHKEVFRMGLQWWGTEFRRGLYGDDYWLQRAEERYHDLVARHRPSLVVFTDVRFPNEGDMIRRLGGKVWRVVRSSLEGITQDEHRSEHAMDGYKADRLIFNDKDLLHLSAEVVRGVLADFGEEVLCTPQ